MAARTLSELTKTESELPTGPQASVVGGGLARIPTGVRVDYRCPHCDSIVYSRKSRWCGVCSQELPESILFTHAEAERVKRLMAVEKERHRRWIAKSFLDAVAVL